MLYLMGGHNMYMNTLLHCHFCIQIITHHFLLSKVSRPIHTIPGIKHTYYTLFYAPGSILSDTNYYIVLYLFVVVSMATNVV